MSRDRARQEKDAFNDLPFVDASKDESNPDRWSPAPVKLQETSRAARTEELLGRVYALDLINHLREYNDFTECLSDVAEAIVKRGKWGQTEIAFFAAIGDYLQRGETWVSAGGVLKIYADNEPPPVAYPEVA